MTLDSSSTALSKYKYTLKVDKILYKYFVLLGGCIIVTYISSDLAIIPWNTEIDNDSLCTCRLFVCFWSSLLLDDFAENPDFIFIYAPFKNKLEELNTTLTVIKGLVRI